LDIIHGVSSCSIINNEEITIASLSSSLSLSTTTSTSTGTYYITTALLFLIFFSLSLSLLFFTVVVNNWLEKRISQPVRPPQRDNNINKEKKYQRSKLIRRAFIGFCSSFVSDCISNGIRVIKTYKQTSDVPITYVEAIMELFHQSNNSLSFLYRGLELKLVCNCLSGILFSILWKMFMERMNNSNDDNNAPITLLRSPILSTTNSSSIDSSSVHGQTVNDEEESIPLLRD
jgi:hypothetical protein